jgi:hypothetical protein
VINGNAGYLIRTDDQRLTNHQECIGSLCK